MLKYITIILTLRIFYSFFLVPPQLSGLYSEVLDRLDKAKRELIMEE